MDAEVAYKKDNEKYKQTLLWKLVHKILLGDLSLCTINGNRKCHRPVHHSSTCQQHMCWPLSLTTRPEEVKKKLRDWLCLRLSITGGSEQIKYKPTTLHVHYRRYSGPQTTRSVKSILTGQKNNSRSLLSSMSLEYNITSIIKKLNPQTYNFRIY